MFNHLQKSKELIAALALMVSATATAQNAIQVGKGSYAAYTPLSKCKTAEHAGDQSQYMQYRKLYLHEREGQPIPTNDWWSNLITEKYSGHLWTYPQFIQAQSYGLDVQWPSYWIEDGTEMKSKSVLKIGGEDFAPESAIAESWHDWDVEFIEKSGDKQMYVTMAHGMPFTWIETQNITPQITIGSSSTVYNSDGNVITSQTTLNKFAVKIGDDFYGIYLPDNTKVSVDKGIVTCQFSGSKQFLSVAVLQNVSQLNTFANFAYAVPRDTKVTWNYAPTDGKVNTNWNVTAEDLRTGAQGVPVMLGFIPHHYRDGATPAFNFDGVEYTTPRGKMKMAEGTQFGISYNFYGMLPYYAVPNDLTGNDPYKEDRMISMVTEYSKNGTFGSDTYWGGKGLTQMALNMMFAREMGQKELFESCRDKLKAALVNWLTYTPGEDSFFFARYDRWGALIGYNTSYDSDTFNDHHFHYGYFTYAGALLALVDNDFRDNYGQMLRQVAKDYANWQRTDTKYPLFRTFDPWAGHSFAGGMGDGNGNGQESSSEAMQSWGGLYLLGVALNDTEMRDAGLFGWVSEARGTAEYWFDRHRDNIDYTKFQHPYNSNLTCHGVGYWTYFGYNSLYMQGIQWMPISPALDYLSEDKAYAKWDYDTMFKDMANGGWLKSTANANGYLGDAGGWGNVALSYLQRSDPDQAAQIFDQLWDNNEPEARTINTNGISYFVIHSHLTYGDLDWETYGSIPTARAYKKTDGTYTYMAYNSGNSAINVDFFRGGQKVYTLTAPARQLAISGAVSKSINEIVEPDNTPADPRESLEMVNLALGKTCYESGHENEGSLPSYATDGDDATRWGSLQQDNQWITVDLGQESSLYKMALSWETAYASEYKVMLSNDNVNFHEAKTVYSTGGKETVMLGDVNARYVKILGVKRGTAYGISLYEIKIYGKHTDAAATDLQGVKITCDDQVLKQGKASQLNIKGYTCANTWVDLTPQWSSEYGTVTTDGMFTPSKYGNVTVKASVNGLSVEKSLVAEEALRATSVKLQPEKVVVVSGDNTEIEAQATDQFGAPFEGADIKYQVQGGTYDASTKKFKAGAPGDYKMIAYVGELTGTKDIADTIDISVRNFTDMNLAFQKPATATSQENDGMAATYATDGSTTTRWGSAWEGLDTDARNNQQITIDLQAKYVINRAVMYWQDARASEYELQVSEDGKTWKDVKQVLNSPSGQEIVDFDAVTARYVRMQGKTRAMDYGYSLFEFEVYGLSKVDDGSGDSGEDSNVNLALGKTAWATSVENDAMAATYATDGNANTRWASLWQGLGTADRNAQSITVDLAATYSINKVTLNWEAAYASQYNILTSIDGAQWNTAKSVTDGKGGKETTSFDTTKARYVRMQGITRGLDYGYSIYEFEVYGKKSGQEEESNIALGKPSWTSSTENDTFVSSAATDGDAATRWASLWQGQDAATRSDQFLAVNLQDNYKVDRVVINWEAAYADAYDIQVSDDGNTWNTVKSVNPGTGGKETVTFDATPARYIRIHCINRALDYGYSIYEFEVYGTQIVTLLPGLNYTVIDDAMSVSNQDCYTVYSLNGFKLKDRVSREELNTLPKGMYIINGKKLIIYK